MRNLWKPSAVRIGSRQAIELRTSCLGYDNVEYCLSSRKGEIWGVGSGLWMAVLKPIRGSGTLSGERLIRFGDGQLEDVIAQLDISPNPTNQTPWANGFSRK